MSRKPASTTGLKPVEPMGLRQRTRADGSVRVWWEPRADAKQLGFAAVELSHDRMTWSRKRAEELNAEVLAARTGQPAPGRRKARSRPAARSIGALIAEYRKSPGWLATLKPASRTSYTILLNQIDAKWGTYAAASFDKATMREWYRTMFATRGAHMSRSLILMMSVLMSFAEELEWRPENTNPCFRLKMVKPAPRQRVGTGDELDAILRGTEALALNAMRLAILIAIFQGQRQTDIRSARRGAFSQITRNGETVWVWQFIRSKRGNMGVMTVHPEVVAALEAALDLPGDPGDLLIRDEATGQPYDQHMIWIRWNSIKTWAANPAGGNCPSVASLQFRDLRRTFGVLARAGGASKDDIGDVLGNSAAVNPLLGETYMPPSFDTASRAVAAVKLPAKKERKKA